MITISKLFADFINANVDDFEVLYTKESIRVFFGDNFLEVFPDGNGYVYDGWTGYRYRFIGDYNQILPLFLD